MRRAGHLQRFQPGIAADAVLGMHDKVAVGQFADIDGEFVAAPALLLRPGQPVAQYVLLRNEADIPGGEAGLQRQHDDAGLGLGQLLRIGPAIDRHQPIDAALGQNRHQPRARTLAVGGDQHAPAVMAIAVEIFADDIVKLGRLGRAHIGEIAAALAAAIDAVEVAFDRAEG